MRLAVSVCTYFAACVRKKYNYNLEMAYWRTCRSWMLAMLSFCVCIIYLVIRNAFYDDYYGMSAVKQANFVDMLDDSKQLRKVRSTTNAERVRMHVPKVIHQMWKSGVKPPPETVRWRHGCMNLNPDYNFHMYDDEDLVAFVENEYPKYLPLFRALNGVYMADMARVLLTYHYGGIYMDLDFIVIAHSVVSRKW